MCHWALLFAHCCTKSSFSAFSNTKWIFLECFPRMRSKILCPTSDYYMYCFTIGHCCTLINFDSDVDFEASRRSTREQSKSTIRSALFLAKH